MTERPDGLPRLKRPDVAKAWDAVTANHEMLGACAGPHDFSVDASPTRSFMKRWACSKCGGVVDTINKIWYERGLEHGAKR